MKVSDAVIKALENLGVRMAFGIPGGTIAMLSHALVESTLIQTVHTQHECGAAYMALGRSLYTSGRNNEIGLCFASSGPGTTNLLTGVASAYEERIPLFVLTGNISTKFRNKGAAQDNFDSGINSLRMFETITCASKTLEDNKNIGAIVKELYDLALLNKQPVHLNIPINISRMDVDENEAQIPTSSTKPVYQTTLHMTEAIHKFFNSKRPLIFCGNGIKTSGLKKLINDFIITTKIPSICSSHAKGVLYESHEYYFGNFGFAANPRAREFLTHYQPDAVLFLGTRLGEVATENWSDLLNIPDLKIQVDINDSHFNRNYQINYGIKTDIAFFIPEALKIFKKISKPFEKKQVSLSNQHRNTLVKPQSQPFSQEEFIKPNELMLALNEFLPDNAYLFSDIGNSMAWLLHDFNLKETQDFYVPVGLGGMGTSICMSIGAKSAATDRPVICITGDCAALMHGMEMFTAKRANYGVKFIILNDGGHGMVSHGQKMLGLKCDNILFDHYLNFKHFGDFFGITTYSAKSMQELSQLPLKAIFDSTEPIIIDLSIDRSIVPPIAARAKAFNQG